MHKEARIANGAFFSLFIISYTPLFVILIYRQMNVYKEFLNWGGFYSQSIKLYIKYFGFISILILIIIFSIVGLYVFLKNMKKRTNTNGERIIIKDIENKNSESITYLFTYIIPFIFQDLSILTDIVPVLILLIVTYFIFINSNLVLINPLLSIKYNLYEIEYSHLSSEKNRKGLILIKENINEDNEVKIKNIGKKLMFGIK